MNKLMLLCVATIALSGCTKPKLTGPITPDSSCVAYRIIHPSMADTMGTKRQILVHNSTYRKICGVK